jgi:hypothetical protein
VKQRLFGNPCPHITRYVRLSFRLPLTQLVTLRRKYPILRGQRLWRPGKERWFPSWLTESEYALTILSMILRLVIGTILNASCAVTLIKFGRGAYPVLTR